MTHRVVVRRTIHDFPSPTPQDTPCRLWQGALSYSTNGYGRRPGGELMHRWVWRVANGPIPQGMKVLHRCDQPLCYRLDHLFLGTDADNVADRQGKGRTRLPEQENQRGARHYRAKLTEADVREIRASTLLQRELAQKYGVSQTAIQKIRSGENWGHVQ